jgi:predicted phage tail protein
MESLTKITLFGVLGEHIGREWNLAIKSVAEATHAINTITKGRLHKFLYEQDKRGLKYRVLINGRDFETNEPLNPQKPQSIANSELMVQFNGGLKTIDIVPVLGGAKDVLTIIAGIVLIVIGVTMMMAGNPFGFALVMAGLGLVAAGVINLLSSPPKFEDFQEIKNGGRVSYLFNGPQNATREGGPVPMGYGQLIVGSQVISASYEISQRSTDIITV